jgi:hypothetical protein
MSSILHVDSSLARPFRVGKAGRFWLGNLVISSGEDFYCKENSENPSLPQLRKPRHSYPSRK